MQTVTRVQRSVQQSNVHSGGQIFRRENFGTRPVSETKERAKELQRGAENEDKRRPLRAFRCRESNGWNASVSGDRMS